MVNRPKEEAGVLLANHGLQPTSQATTVRAPGGKRDVGR